MTILETERLILRKLTIEDARRLSEYRSKKEVAKYQSWDRYSYLTAKRRCHQSNRIPTLFKVGTDYNLAVVLKESDYLIGDLFVAVISKTTLSLGYTLDSAFWHQGYMSEMLEEVFRQFKLQGIEKIICYIYPENNASKKLLERFGFEQYTQSAYYGDVGYKKVL